MMQFSIPKVKPPEKPKFQQGAVKHIFPGSGFPRFRIFELTELKVSDKAQVNGTNIYTRIVIVYDVTTRIE